MLSKIKKIFFRDVCLLLHAFLVYLRLLLEYNSVIWSPSAIKDILAILEYRGVSPTDYMD